MVLAVFQPFLITFLRQQSGDWKTKRYKRENSDPPIHDGLQRDRVMPGSTLPTMKGLPGFG